MDQPRFKHNTRAKWSDRAAELFKLSGKLWNKTVKMQLKRTVADACIANGIVSLNEHKRGPVSIL